MAIPALRRGTTAALALALGCAVVTAVPATAMVDWSEPAYVTGSRYGGVVSVVTDSQGDAWVLADGEADMVLAEHPADGGEPIVHTLPAGRSSMLVIDSEDRLTVVYITYHGGDAASVMARAVTPDGTLGPAQVVSSTEYFPNLPRAAVAPDGVVTVVWGEMAAADGRTSRVRMARLAPATAAPLGAPIPLDEPRTRVGFIPQIAADDDGEMTVAWIRRNLNFGEPPEPPGLFAVRIDSAGVPGELRRVSPRSMGIVGDVGDVVVGPRDGATIVWTADTRPRSTWAARLPAGGGAVTDRVRVSEREEASVGAPAATLDPSGRVTVVWARRATRPDSGQRYVENRRLSASGTPQRVRPELGVLDHRSAAEFLGVVADDHGFVTVVWPAREQSYDLARTHSVRLDPRGRPSSERRVERQVGLHGFSLDVALAPDGSVVATWLNRDGSYLARSAPPSEPLVPADTGFAVTPQDPTTERRPRVVLYSPVLAATFECRLDGARWQPCQERVRLPLLSYGEHRLAVRATDPDGTGPDLTPAVSRFEVVRD